MPFQNPFEIISPEDLTPEEIKNLFVKSYTELNILKSRKHTIIHGSRGNGKSMLLRFLEPKCQILDQATTAEDYFKSYSSFFGIYIPFKEGYFNKTDFLTQSPQNKTRLSGHLVNMHIISSFIDILSQQLPSMCNRTIEHHMSKEIVVLLDKKNLYSIERNNRQFGFQEVRDIIRKEINHIDEYLSCSNFPNFETKYKGNFTSYHTFIKPFFRKVRELISSLKNVPFYFLFDEADRLYEFQKAYINTMIANRDHKLISIKLASKIGGYGYYYTESNTLINDIHDFDTIVLDELYTHSKDSYYNKIKEIANKRLELTGFNTEMTSFMPESESEKSLFEKIKQNTAKEWDLLPIKIKTKDRNNYVNKYATARLFQYLAKKKIQKRYSGFNNLVHFSSGIVRNFLHPAYYMFNDALDEGHDFGKLPFIPEQIQNDRVNVYSNNFFQELDKALEGLKKDSKEDQHKIEIVNKLKILIENLGEIFYKKLTDEKSHDPRIISFALRDEPDAILKDVLNYAVSESFFHKLYTTSKSGGGRYECYILNRALCPRFKLDLSSLRGRIVVSSRMLALLISPDQSRKTILKKFIGEEELSNQNALFTLDEVQYETDD
jgi:hypothetical protein